jgi:hypothetical protein
MFRAHHFGPLAILIALSLAVVSYACVVSCCNVQAAVPPCHHHKSSCVPLLLTGEAPSASASATEPPAIAMSVSAGLPALKTAADVSTALDPFHRFSPPGSAIKESPSRVPAILRI